MLNALKLSDLLAKNVHPQLYPRMFVMSPNGTLMAYSTPIDIRDLRDQAALISMAWKEHEVMPSQESDATSPAALSDSRELETLTIEFQHNNIIVRAIQPNLLLVLVGGVPPSRKSIFSITSEAKGDARYPPIETSAADAPSSSDTLQVLGEGMGTPKKAASILSHMSQRDKDINVGALHIQRKKIDALTAYIRGDFEAKGFVMPDDSNFQ